MKFPKRAHAIAVLITGLIISLAINFCSPAGGPEADAPRPARLEQVGAVGRDPLIDVTMHALNNLYQKINVITTTLAPWAKAYNAAYALLELTLMTDSFVQAGTILAINKPSTTYLKQQKFLSAIFKATEHHALATATLAYESENQASPILIELRQRGSTFNLRIATIIYAGTGLITLYSVYIAFPTASSEWENFQNLSYEEQTFLSLNFIKIAFNLISGVSSTYSAYTTFNIVRSIANRPNLGISTTFKHTFIAVNNDLMPRIKDASRWMKIPEASTKIVNLMTPSITTITDGVKQYLQETRNVFEAIAPLGFEEQPLMTMIWCAGILLSGMY